MAKPATEQATGKEAVACPCPRKEDSQPAVFIPVDRLPEIQEARLKLPVLAEEQVIMEAVREHACTVLCGETAAERPPRSPSSCTRLAMPVGVASLVSRNRDEWLQSACLSEWPKR
ncbi:hypothetical protein SKAU_G00005870 [Synaphobranchus kaupii]|uniref:Uncharacterized protein n=1 Tax=Synaphobranchus kaupii TaxID=118154 RepID=A0A9Q1GA99_SYNKA|nr:hypothetical protein SKAU_G00005870 [Synaphobranchus kaupii]